MGVVKSAFSDLEARGHALIAQLEEKGHELAAEFRTWFDELTGRLPAVEAEVKADAEQVAHDAVAVEAPVVNEAVQDVAAIGETAVAGDVTSAATEPAQQ